MRLALLRIHDINNRSMLFNNLIHPYIFMAKSNFFKKKIFTIFFLIFFLKDFFFIYFLIFLNFFFFKVKPVSSTSANR